MEARLELIGIVLGHFLLLKLVLIHVAINEDTLRVIFVFIENVLRSCSSELVLRLEATRDLSISVILHETSLFLVLAKFLEWSGTGAKTGCVAVSNCLVLMIQLLKLHFVLVNCLCRARLDEIVD